MKIRPLFSTLALVPILAGPVMAQHGAGGGSPSSLAGPSDEGKNQIKTFQFDPGLKCELWAAEPMLGNPVCFTQDEKGRWYVAETFRLEGGLEDDRGHAEWLDEDIAAKTVADRLAYMHAHMPDPAKFAAHYETLEDRIRVLEDTTGSGVANKVTVYADGFKQAESGVGAGLVTRNGEVWYTCIPNLWRFKDTNDDGAADVKDKLLTGFGVKFSFKGHDMHGLRFGPDGKLYFSIGDRGFNVVTKEGKQISNTESGSIMRCNPDGTDFELYATGVRNPQELAFDAHGNLFTDDNNCDAGDKSRVTYLVEGGDCGWRMAFQYLEDRGPWMRERPWDVALASSFRYINPCFANLANGPSGITYNPGTGLSEKYYGKFFLSDFRGGSTNSVVYEMEMKPKGAFFSLESREVIKGVLSTDVEFGNDGSLYVLDWVANWSGVGKGRIYKFTDQAANTALQKETETLIRDGMSKRPNAELAKLLSHADMRIRQAAQFELVSRAQDPKTAEAASVLTEAARDTKAANPLSRLHGIWGLGQLAGKEHKALDVLANLLDDADPEVRAQAAKLVGDYKDEDTASKLTAMLKDKEGRVRYFAAMALGKIGYKAAFEPLVALLAENDDKDPILRHGGVMGLIGCGAPEQICALARNPSVAVRGDACVALRRLQSPLIAAFLQDTDESVVLEAARAIHDAPIEGALPALAALVANPGEKNPYILSRAVNAHYRLGKAEDAKALATFAASNAAPVAARADALAALGLWGHPNAKDRLLNQWRPLPDRGPDDAVAAVTTAVPALLREAPGSVQEQVAKLVAKLSIPGVGEPLALLASNDKADSAARVAALKTLATLKDASLAKAARAAVIDKDVKIRSAGLQALAESDPTATAKMITEMVDTGSPAERQGAVLALGQIKGREADTLIAGLLDKLIANQLPGEIQLDLLEVAQKRNTPEIKDRLAKYNASLPADDELAKYRVALLGGNAENGRKVFREHPQAQCIRCHKCEIGDSQVGPELTHIGALRDRPYLLEAIILPSKTIAPGFETVVLTLNNGDIVAGTLSATDATGAKTAADALSVKVFDATGKMQIQTVPLAQVKERQTAPSPMPPNLGEFLTRSDLRDVIEYLSSLK